MTKDEFFKSFVSPLPGAVLTKAGNLRQYWAESPKLYANYFGLHDDYSISLCGHSGIDIATFQGDTVVAAHDGTISRIVRQARLGGNVVWVQSPYFTDNGVECFAITAYGHLDTIDVEVGDLVRAGEKIGTEGNSGFVVSGNTPYWGNAPAGKGVHLHFSYTEFIRNGTYRFPNCLGNTSDPLPLIQYKNPDYSGTQILLTNMASYLRSLLRRLAL